MSDYQITYPCGLCSFSLDNHGEFCIPGRNGGINFSIFGRQQTEHARCQYNFLQQVNVKKCHDHPVYGAGISNPRPLKHGLSPTTTRPIL